MNKKLVAAGMMIAASTASHAQNSNVTIYGLIDSGIEHLTNVGATGDGVTRVPTLTAAQPSRIGFRGTEDLGGGLKAVLTLESGFAPDSGLAGQGGRLFGRQAFVGIAGSWGTVTVGRQYSMLFWANLDSNIQGPNIHGLGAIDAYIPNARTDNALAYRGSFKGLAVGATYSFGRDGVNAGPSPSGTNCAGENPADRKACREWSAMLKYDTPGWGVAAAHDRQNGGPGAFAGLTSSALSDSRTTLGAYLKFGTVKLGGGVLHRDNEAIATPKSNLFYLGVSYPLTPVLTVDAQAAKLDFKNSANGASTFVVRGLYFFSKRTMGYVSAGHISNDGTSNLSISSGAAGSNPAAGRSQTGLMLGLQHTF